MISLQLSTATIIFLSLYVWLGWNGSEALHIYGWALTTDAFQSKMNGPFANGNVLAIIIVCAWSICSYFWLNEEKTLQWVWLFSLLFFWIFIFSSMARGAWFAQFIVLAWLVIELVRRQQIKKIVLLLIVGLIAWAAGDTLAQKNQSQLGGIQQQFEKSVESGLAERVTLWQSVWEVYKSHPILGVGPSQLKAHYLTGQSKALDNATNMNGLRDTDSGHNILLHLMAEYGIAGLILWLVVSALILRLLWLYRHKLDSIRWPAFACALVLWTQGHFNITLTEPFPLILFALMFAISAKPLMRAHNFKIKKHWLLAVSGIVIVFLASGAIQTTKAWQDFGDWMHMDYKHPEKGKLAAELASHDELLPYIVEFSINEMVHMPGKQAMIGKMEPMILRALSLHQRPRLYKQLFFSQLINKYLEQACETGKFIQSQRWKNEPNDQAYAQACMGIQPAGYQF